jgi:hypothetical protein
MLPTSKRERNCALPRYVAPTSPTVQPACSGAQHLLTSQLLTLQVTLWNTGPPEDTYRPDLFGPMITIHKTLNARGHTSTKVLDSKGMKTNLTKADDVQQLLSKLSVNAANPSIVLTQVLNCLPLGGSNPASCQEISAASVQPLQTLHVCRTMPEDCSAAIECSASCTS